MKRKFLGSLVGAMSMVIPMAFQAQTVFQQEYPTELGSYHGFDVEKTPNGGYKLLTSNDQQQSILTVDQYGALQNDYTATFTSQSGVLTPFNRSMATMSSGADMLVAGKKGTIDLEWEKITGSGTVSNPHWYRWNPGSCTNNIVVAQGIWEVENDNGSGSFVRGLFYSPNPCAEGDIQMAAGKHHIVFKLNSTGIPVWSVELDTTSNLILNTLGSNGDLYPTSDGGFVYTGQYTGSGGTITNVIKVDGSGSTNWGISIYDGANTTEGTSITSIGTGSSTKYFLTSVNANGSSSITKLSSTGVVEWSRRYTYSGGSVIFRSVMAQSTNTNDPQDLLVAGNIKVGSTEKGLLIKVKTQGTTSQIGSILWQRSYNDYKRFHSVKPTSDGGCIAAGTTDNNWPGLVKTDDDGLTGCNQSVSLHKAKYTPDTTFENGASLIYSLISTSYPYGSPVANNYSDEENCCNFEVEDTPVSICPGASATLDPNPYSSYSAYLWSTGATTNSISVSAAGTYTVTFTQPNGCQGVAAFIVTQSPGVSLSQVATPTSCPLSTDGSVALTINSGTSPYTFLWSNGSTNQNLSNVAAGNYTVTVTDANGCTASISSNVSTTSTLFVNAAPNPAYVPLNNVAIINAAASGGSGNYLIEWSYFSNFSSSFASGATLFTAPITTTTIIYARVTDLNSGCTYINSVTIYPTSCTGGAPEETTITNQTVTWNTPMLINTDIHVGPGGVLNITNTSVFFNACTRLVVEQGGQLNIDGSTLTSCDQWMGIEVWGDAGNPDRTVGQFHGSINMDHSTISNADIAIMIGGRSGSDYQPGFAGGIFNISSGNIFINNIVHMMVSEYEFDYGGLVEQSNFYPIMDDNSLVCFFESNTIVTNTDNRKHLYLDGCNDVTFSENFFFDPWIDSTTINYWAGSDYFLQVGYLQNIDGNMTFDDNDVEVWIELGATFVCNSCNNVLFSDNSVNSVQPTPKCFDLTSGSGYDLIGNNIGSSNVTGCGIIATSVTDLLLRDNVIASYNSGLEFYPNAAQGQDSYVENNTFNGMLKGIVVNEVDDPFWGTQPSNSYFIRLKTYCNSFNTAQYAIYGAGKLVTQGTGSVAAGNVFNTTANWYDIAWWSGSPSFDYYYEQNTPGHQPSTSYGGSELMFSAPLTSTSVNPIGINDGGVCTYSLPAYKRGESEDAGIETDLGLAAYPNPNNGEFDLKWTPSEAPGRIVIFNAMGQVVHSAVLQANQGSTQVALSKLGSGVYYVKLSMNEREQMLPVIVE
ncbi:MAG: T9SS type A sorting domain-containing protein [Flavobacteriales bacterium]